MRFFVALILVFSGIGAFGQQNEPTSTQQTESAKPQAAPAGESQVQPDSPAPQSTEAGANATQSPAQTAPAAAPQTHPPSSSATSSPLQPRPKDQAIPLSKQQPKRILGVMPNYRAVSAGAIPPPPTPKQAFKIATQNSFDYSSFVFVGMTSAIAEWTDAHPKLGEGMAGYGRYYWRGFVDKTDGNYLVIFLYPTIFHQDERYYALGEGGLWKRATYASTRIFVTPNYHGKRSINFSELLGRASAQAISTTYYPSSDRTAAKMTKKLAFALGRDALTNTFREFWPDISAHLFHKHDQQQ